MKNKTTKIENFCRFGNPFRISKKAQLTLFIIIGIVILLGTATVIYVRQTTEGGLLEDIPAGRETKYDFYNR